MAYKVELECTTNKSNFTSISHSTYLNLLDHESKLKLAHLPPAIEISNVASSPRTTQNNSISPNIILMVLLLLFLFYSFQNFNCMRNTLYSPPSASLVFSHHHYHRTASDFDAKSAFAVFYISIANLCANHRLRKSIVVMLLIASSSISLISAQNSSSYFDCQSDSQCNHDLYCIDGQDCDVICTGTDSCRYGAIHQPNTGNLTVHCSGTNACSSLAITGPINGSLILFCGGNYYSGCRATHAICPVFGECFVEVLSHYTTNDITVDARNMQSGGLYVSNAQRSIIQCPGNNLECIANCSDIACTGTLLHTQNDSILRVFASGVSSLQSVTVYCALNAICSVNVTEPASDPLSHFKLYSIDALDGVSFLCDYMTDASECYSLNDPPQLWCKSEYDTGCSLEYNAMNQWQCTNNMSVSELCTNNETLPGYYGSQIVCQYNDECTYDMYCIDGQNCDVTCAGWRSCESGVIHQPDTGNLSVTCSTEHSCRDMTITAPINGSLALSCAGAHSDSACNGIYAICPIYGDCSVQVSSWHGLNDMTVDASNMTSGHLFVSAIQKSIIKCPGNQLECIADCVDVSCTGTSFHARNDSILRVSASGVSSLQSVNLYCAANANCSIVVDCGAQRSAICDIESQTGTAYDQWQCNTKSSKYPIVNFTDICRTHDPTIDPTTDPTIDPSHPTANPSADLYTTPLSSWGETSITIVCACYFDEDKIDTINDIIIAYLDDDARIVGTKITTHAVSVIVAHADSNTLDHDMISRDIEVKLKDQYDVDVDVTFDDTDDDEHQKRKPNIIQFLLAHVSKDVVIGLMIGFLLFVFVFIIGCICFCFHKRVKKRVKMQEVMMAKQQMDTQTGKEPNDTRTKEHAQDISMDVVPGGNDDGHDTDDSLYAVEDDGERGNVNDLTLGNTQTRKEPTDTTNAHDWNDDENDTDESLYDAGEEDGKGGITIGNTIA